MDLVETSFRVFDTLIWYGLWQDALAQQLRNNFSSFNANVPKRREIVSALSSMLCIGPQ